MPRGGHCPGCGKFVLWGDVIKGCYRRQFGNLDALTMHNDADVEDNVENAHKEDSRSRNRRSGKRKKNETAADSSSDLRDFCDMEVASSSTKPKDKAKSVKRRRQSGRNQGSMNEQIGTSTAVLDSAGTSVTAKEVQSKPGRVPTPFPIIPRLSSPYSGSPRASTYLGHSDSPGGCYIDSPPIAFEVELPKETLLERSMSVLSVSSRPCSPMLIEISSD